MDNTSATVSTTTASPDAPPTTTTTTAATTQSMQLSPIAGATTSEFWFKAAICIVAVLLGTGVIPSISNNTAIVSMLGLFGVSSVYTASRTYLKAQHVASGASTPIYDLASAVLQSLVKPIGAAAVLVLLCVGISTTQAGCGGTITAAKTGAKQGGSDFLACEKVDLVGLTTNISVLGQVAGAVEQGNYEDALDGLALKLGEDAIGCATIAVKDVVGSILASLSSGTTATPATNAGALALKLETLKTTSARLDEVISKHPRWARTNAAKTTPASAQ